MFWGLDTQVQVLKVEVPDVRFKPFAPHGKALGCDGVHGAIVPQPLLAASVFSPLIFTHPICRSLSARFPPPPPEETYAIDSVERGSSYVATLNRNFPFYELQVVAIRNKQIT